MRGTVLQRGASLGVRGTRSGAFLRTIGAALQYIGTDWGLAYYLLFAPFSAFGVRVPSERLSNTYRLGGLFAPFPWDIVTTLQAAAMPETLLWYPLFLLSILGFRISLRNRRTAALVPLSVLLVVVSSYALVEGNFGTAYRHRAQIMPLFFVFSGVGLSWIKVRVISQTNWWRTRTRLRVRG